jgi:hypothetical protein
LQAVLLFRAKWSSCDPGACALVGLCAAIIELLTT